MTKRQQEWRRIGRKPISIKEGLSRSLIYKGLSEYCKDRIDHLKTMEMDIENFGIYRMGMTIREIKEYLKKRAGVTKLGHLYEKFCRVAGTNTVSAGRCEFCGKQFSLMYRCDVVRFTNLLLKGTPTYFD